MSLDIPTLKERVASSKFNFKDFVEVITNDGFVTEYDQLESCSITTPQMERCTTLQEQFDELFEFFYPETLNEVKLQCISTNAGLGNSTAYAYAIYNETVIAEYNVKKELIKQSGRS